MSRTLKESERIIRRRLYKSVKYIHSMQYDEIGNSRNTIEARVVCMRSCLGIDIHDAPCLDLDRNIYVDAQVPARQVVGNA